MNNITNFKVLEFVHNKLGLPSTLGDKVYLVSDTNKILEIDPGSLFLNNQGEKSIKDDCFQIHNLNSANHLLTNDHTAWVISQNGNECL